MPQESVASLMQQARSCAAMRAGSGKVKKGQNDADYITGENIAQAPLPLRSETMFDGKKSRFRVK
eukprot:7469204-Heterocapsa_arctica.AAC.1